MVKNVKIAMLDFLLWRHRMQMGVNIVVKDVKRWKRSRKERQILPRNESTNCSIRV